MKKSAIFFAVLILAAVAGSLACGKEYWNYKGLKIPKQFDKNFTTAGAIHVQADVDVPAASLEAIERGIQTQIDAATAAHPTWGCAAFLSFYKVSFIEPTALTSGGMPSLLFGGQNIAGTVTGTSWDNFPYQSMVLPHQAPTWQWLEYLENASRYESEHLRAWNCDKEIFFETSVPGHMHPIFPREGERPAAWEWCSIK